MADTKISGMTAASALTGAEVLPVVQSAANVKATTQQVVDAAMTTGLTRQALGSINTNTTIDWSAGSYATATIAGALTFTFSNPAPTGKACVAYLQLTNGGSAVITWPVSVTWSGGTAPTLRASGVDLLRFYTQDGGTTWFGTAENDEPDTTNTPGTKTLASFTASDNQPPASSFATLDTRNSIPVLDFDAAADESAIFSGFAPEGIVLTSGIIARIVWAATSATTGNVRWRVAFERRTTDQDSDSFDTATEATDATNGTSGICEVCEITCTTIDSIVAGDSFRVRVTRVGTDGTNDTMTGDAELFGLELRAA